MSMRALRGLEMICLTRDGHFELQYGGAGQYADPKGKPVKDLMDMGCVACSARFFTREKAMIDFCPACGFMERKRFDTFQKLQEWSVEQNWKFLQVNGMKAFGALRTEAWRLVFAGDRMELESKGVFDEIHDLLQAAPPRRPAAAPPTAPPAPGVAPPAPSRRPEPVATPGVDPRFAGLELD